jgi:hypothetical protein
VPTRPGVTPHSEKCSCPRESPAKKTPRRTPAINAIWIIVLLLSTLDQSPTRKLRSKAQAYVYRRILYTLISANRFSINPGQRLTSNEQQVTILTLLLLSLCRTRESICCDAARLARVWMCADRTGEGCWK